MSSNRNQRPAGLTALAIINFVEFAMGALGLVGAAFTYWGGQIENEGFTSASGFFVVVTFNGLLCILLLISGIGLMGCRKILGRHLVSAIFAVALIKGVYVVQNEPDQFDLILVAFVVWPLITTILVNTVFREDLVK